MNFTQLCYFRTLAKLEHYTRAAEELDISQSALSQSISSLENELNTYLFEKQGRNIVLTKSGKTFLKYVEISLDTLEKGKEELVKLNTMEKGKISLGIISGVGHFIPYMMSDFLKIPPYANISFSCTEGTTDQLLKKLKDGFYDLVICSKRDNVPNIDFLPIIEGRLVVLLPNGHRLANKEQLQFADISSYPFIIHTSDCGMRTITEELFMKYGLTPKIAMEAQDDAFIAKLVESNHGIALITEIPEIRKYNISVIPLAPPYAQRLIYLAFVKNRYLPPAVDAFKMYLLSNSMTAYIESR